MGADPEGKLFYGFVWEADEQPEDHDSIHRAMVDSILAGMPVVEGESGYDRRRRAEKELCAEWGLHGSDYELKHFLCAPETLKTAEWGDTVTFDPRVMADLQAAGAWDVLLLDYLEKAGIEPPRDNPRPAWHLACLYF